VRSRDDQGPEGGKTLAAQGPSPKQHRNEKASRGGNAGEDSHRGEDRIFGRERKGETVQHKEGTFREKDLKGCNKYESECTSPANQAKGGCADHCTGE